MTVGGTYRINQQEGANERLRWYQAAVAAAPAMPAAHNSLGIALRDKNDPAGADTTSFAGRTKVSVVVGDLASAVYNSADQTTATVTIVFRASSAGTMVNDAVVSAANPDPYQPNNYATITRTAS